MKEIIAYMAAHYYELIQTAAKATGWSVSYTRIWVEDMALGRLGFYPDDEIDDFMPVLEEEIRILRELIANSGYDPLLEPLWCRTPHLLGKENSPKRRERRSRVKKS